MQEESRYCKLKNTSDEIEIPHLTLVKLLTALCYTLNAPTRVKGEDNANPYSNHIASNASKPQLLGLRYAK